MPTEKEIQDVKELMKKGRDFAKEHGIDEDLEEKINHLDESIGGFDKAADEYLKNKEGE